MEIIREADMETVEGPDEYFTGKPRLPASSPAPTPQTSPAPSFVSNLGRAPHGIRTRAVRH